MARVFTINGANEGVTLPEQVDQPDQVLTALPGPAADATPHTPEDVVTTAADRVRAGFRPELPSQARALVRGRPFLEDFAAKFADKVRQGRPFTALPAQALSAMPPQARAALPFVVAPMAAHGRPLAGGLGAEESNVRQALVGLAVIGAMAGTLYVFGGVMARRQARAY